MQRPSDKVLTMSASMRSTYSARASASVSSCTCAWPHRRTASACVHQEQHAQATMDKGPAFEEGCRTDAPPPVAQTAAGRRAPPPAAAAWSPAPLTRSSPPAPEAATICSNRARAMPADAMTWWSSGAEYRCVQPRPGLALFGGAAAGWGLETPHREYGSCSIGDVLREVLASRLLLPDRHLLLNLHPQLLQQERSSQSVMGVAYQSPWSAHC